MTAKHLAYQALKGFLFDNFAQISGLQLSQSQKQGYDWIMTVLFHNEIILQLKNVSL